MYDTLDKLPVKRYFQILETGDFNLLLQKKDKVSEEELLLIWEKIFEEFSNLNEDVDTKKTLRIAKDVERNQIKYKLVQNFCIALDFDWDDELVEILRDWGYTLTKENYYEDLEKIKRESEGLLLKAENSKKQMPKIDEDSDVTVDDVLASYSSIMGFDFDYDTIVCTKYLALKKQINAKIKIAEANNQQNQKGNKNGK